ncbi:MAG TPA: NAD-dependent epimerase/dehydratase family protein [Spirochaetota bacterium]|nr:NAD-dependent epimerase/dehydratase family protein [Spirochaetota bacterium]
MARKTALVAGATGLIGGHVLRLLLENDHYAAVKALTRRSTGVSHAKLAEHIVDFDDANTLAPHAAADDVFCCLGTTIKKAGTKEAFYTVDFTYPLSLAKVCAASGAGQFLIVTALGADPRSPVFYNRVKGEVEAALRETAFRAVHIFRPSLLLGERKEKRPAEEIAGVLSRALAPLMAGPLAKYRPIEARHVARAMVAIATGDRPTGIYESHIIRRIAGGAA